MPTNHLLTSNDAQQAHAIMLPDLTDNREINLRKRKIEQIVKEDRKGDDQGLTDFDAINAGEDVDGISRECREKRHVDVVERTCEEPGDGWEVMMRSRTGDNVNPHTGHVYMLRNSCPRGFEHT